MVASLGGDQVVELCPGRLYSTLAWPPRAWPRIARLEAAGRQAGPACTRRSQPALGTHQTAGT
jgi:hypothetical protein